MALKSTAQHLLMDVTLNQLNQRIAWMQFHYGWVNFQKEPRATHNILQNAIAVERDFFAQQKI